jgi:hypothetical protein
VAIRGAHGERHFLVRRGAWALKDHNMKKSALIPLPVLVLMLSACGDAPPVTLNASQRAYFGSWEHVGSEYGNNIVSDNMLLIFHPDSSVSYKRCINRMNGYSYTSLPGSRLEGLSDRQLAISAGVWKLRWTKELRIDRAPYIDGDEMYLDVDGLKLRRLKDGESSTHEAWKCDSDKR